MFFMLIWYAGAEGLHQCQETQEQILSVFFIRIIAINLHHIIIFSFFD